MALSSSYENELALAIQESLLLSKKPVERKLSFESVSADDLVLIKDLEISELNNIIREKDKEISRLREFIRDNICK